MARDIRACCEHGSEHGVVIALQHHNDFLKKAADVEELFERVDSPWLGLNLDIGSYRVHDPYAEIERNIKRAVTWQIKENVWVDGLQVPTDLERLDGQEQVLEARRAMAQAILWFAIAPAIAPILGGWLHEMFGWRSVFWYRLQRKNL